MTPALGHRPWAADLLADRAFRSRLAARWLELRRGDLLGDVLRRLDAGRAALRPGWPRNARRWPGGRRASAAAQSLRLRAWLIDRARWIDANIAALANEGASP